MIDYMTVQMVANLAVAPEPTKPVKAKATRGRKEKASAGPMRRSTRARNDNDYRTRSCDNENSEPESEM